MTREQLLENFVDVLKDMSPKERGQLVADIVQISLKLTTDELINSDIKDIINKKSGGVS